MSRNKNFLPHSQISRIMREVLKDSTRISKKAISKLEVILVTRIETICNNALKIMGYQNRLTLYRDDLEIQILGGDHTTLFSLESVKRLIKKNGILRMQKEAIEKINFHLISFVYDISKEAEKFAIHAGRMTIFDKDIVRSLALIEE